MRKHRLWIIGLGCPLLIVVPYAAYFGPQILTYRQIRRGAWQEWWPETPRPLSDTSVSTAPSTTLSYYGYKFEAPWVGIKKEENDPRWSRVFFNTGQDISLWNPDYSQRDQSYQYLRTILSMTPSQLSPFRSHTNFARSWAYLESKGLLLEHNRATGIFNIQNEAHKGFEISEISTKGLAQIILFDTADRELILQVSGIRDTPDTRRKLSQAEVNRVIQSFTPDPSKLPSTNTPR